MRLARYWAREGQSFRDPDGKFRRVDCWGWSESSEEEARQRAREAARRAVDRIRSGQGEKRTAEGGRPAAYGYGDGRPMREEILEQMADERGALLAAITRNREGALVLNTRDLMFIDIDFSPEPVLAGLIRAVKRLFGRPVVSVADQLRARIESQLGELPQYAARLYRTRFGFRCAIVDRPIEPGGSESEWLLDKLQADPLYVRLCKTQECYRARLTPKFWRCGMDRPPGRFPFLSAEQEAAFRQWEARYEAAIQGLAACRLVGEFGNGAVRPEFRGLIALHDRLSRAEEDLPLA